MKKAVWYHMYYTCLKMHGKFLVITAQPPFSKVGTVHTTADRPRPPGAVHRTVRGRF